MGVLPPLRLGGRRRVSRRGPALPALAALLVALPGAWAGCGPDEEGRAAVADASRAAQRLTLGSAQELPPGVTPAMVAEGRRIFLSSGFCQNCHGPDAKGLPQLGTDLTDDEWRHTDGGYEGLLARIREGVPAERSASGVPMPPLGGARLEEDELRAVAAYVWTLSR